jgi:3-hydroxy-3-methylglutaryl CoA synthase
VKISDGKLKNSSVKDNHLTADFTRSIRSVTIALSTDMDSVNSGPSHRMLVVAADCRIPAPGSEHETVFDYGSAALFVGDSYNSQW